MDHSHQCHYCFDILIHTHTHTHTYEDIQYIPPSINGHLEIVAVDGGFVYRVSLFGFLHSIFGYHQYIWCLEYILVSVQQMALNHVRHFSHGQISYKTFQMARFSVCVYVADVSRFTMWVLIDDELAEVLPCVCVCVCNRCRYCHYEWRQSRELWERKEYMSH